MEIHVYSPANRTIVYGVSHTQYEENNQLVLHYPEDISAEHEPTKIKGGEIRGVVNLTNKEQTALCSDLASDLQNEDVNVIIAVTNIHPQIKEAIETLKENDIDVKNLAERIMR